MVSQKIKKQIRAKQEEHMKNLKLKPHLLQYTEYKETYINHINEFLNDSTIAAGQYCDRDD